jgi:hypothetical protein
MKVDMKIVPIEVEEGGWFSKKKKKMHRLQSRIILSDVERAIINKAGLRDFVWLEFEQHTPDGSYSEVVQCLAAHLVDHHSEDYSDSDFDTLVEAQAHAQATKAGLVHLKEAMDLHTDTPTEESFEL